MFFTLPLTLFFGFGISEIKLQLLVLHDSSPNPALTKLKLIYSRPIKSKEWILIISESMLLPLSNGYRYAALRIAILFLFFVFLNCFVVVKCT